MGLAERPAARPSFVEGLERWLGWTDAIALSNVLSSREGGFTPQAGGEPHAPVAAPAARRALTQLQASLTRRIERDGLGDEDVEFAPWRHHCHEVRHAMERDLPPLRAQLRAALASRGQAQARLAALDAVMEQALQPREQAVLAALPAWLHKRFEQCRMPAPAAARPTRAATPRHPWLQTFRQDMRRLLQAELALRMQPLAGLCEAIESQEHAA